MKSKIWILLLMIILIVTFSIILNLNQNYIQSRKINYLINEKGEIQVTQEDIYIVKEPISNINTYILLPIKDILINLDEYKLKSQKIENISVQILDGMNNTIFCNTPIYSITDRYIYAGTYLEKGTYKVTTKYTMFNTLHSYDDVCELYTKIIPEKEKIDVNEIEFNIKFNSNVKLSNYTKYLYSNYDITKTASNNRNLQYKNSDIKEDDNLQIRLLFDKTLFNENIAKKAGNLEQALDDNITIIQNRNRIIKVLDVVAIFSCVVLIIYFIYLVYRYDYQDFGDGVGKSYEEVLEKLNPIVGACILQERDAQIKDILSLLLDLVNKKILDLKIKKYEYEAKYILIQNEEFFKEQDNIKNMDVLDKEVLDLFFYSRDYENEFNLQEYKKQIDLAEEIIEIKKDFRRFEKLKSIISNINCELENIGASGIEINHSTKIKHNLIMVISIILLIFRIIYKISTDIMVKYSESIFAYNSLDNIYEILHEIGVLLILFGALNICLEVITLIIIWFVNIFEYLLKKMRKGIKKYLFVSTTYENKVFLSSTRNVMRILQKYIILIALIVTIIYRFLPDSVSVQYIILIILATLIVVTDDYMKKHLDTLKSTYLGLKILEDKLINGSYLSEKDFGNIILWNKYLTFSLALGFTKNEEYIDLLNSPINSYLDEKKLISKILNPKLYVDLMKSFLSRNSK